MSETLKHKAPLRCRLHTLVFGSSVSVKLASCLIGCKKRCKKCSGCENNIPELWIDNFNMGMAAVNSEFKEAIYETIKRQSIQMCKTIQP